MHQQNKEGASGELSGGASSSGSKKEPRRSSGVNTPCNDNSHEVSPRPKQGSVEGAERVKAANMHDGARQELTEIPVEVDMPDCIGDALQMTETHVKPSWPENLVHGHNHGTEGDEPLWVTNGFRVEPELKDKTIDCQVISQSAIVQPEDVRMQTHGREVKGTAQLPSNQNEGFRQKGSYAPGESAINNTKEERGGQRRTLKKGRGVLNLKKHVTSTWDG